jgi:hypothetical protein
MSEMDRDEMIEILEEIARDPKQQPGARVTALRTLRELRDEDEAKDPPTASTISTRLASSGPSGPSDQLRRSYFLHFLRLPLCFFLHFLLCAPTCPAGE